MIFIEARNDYFNTYQLQILESSNNVWDLMEDYYSESIILTSKISWGIFLYLHDGTHMKQESMTYLVIMKYLIINTVGKIREKIY